MNKFAKIFIGLTLVGLCWNCTQSDVNTDELVKKIKENHLVYTELENRIDVFENDRESTKEDSLAILSVKESFKQLKEDLSILLEEYETYYDAKITIRKDSIKFFKNKITSLKEQYPIEKTHFVSVKIKVLEPETFQSKVILSGVVEAENDVNVFAEMPGRIKKIHVKEGQRVKKGDLLAEMNTGVIRNQMEALKANLELAKSSFSKQKKLWKEDKIGSEIQYLQAKAAKESAQNQYESLQAQLAMSLIKAPFDGIVDDVFLKVGDMAQMSPVLQIVNLDKVKITADVSEKYIAKISKGDKVKVRFPSYPDVKPQEYEISRTGNVINPNNRTFKIQLNINNIQEKFKPNMLASIELVDYSRDSVFVLPSKIIKKEIGGDKNQFVFEVVEENGVEIAKRINIETAAHYDKYSYVNKGLTAKKRIVIEGENMISNGSRVVIIND